MPDEQTVKRARKARSEGKAPSTQAGDFVREEIHHVREGKHGARSSKQAIAIGLSKARRGVELPPPEEGAAPEKTREQVERELRNGKSATKPSSKRSRARKKALKREPHKAASKAALSRHAKSAAHKRTKAERSASAKKAARTRKK